MAIVSAVHTFSCRVSCRSAYVVAEASYRHTHSVGSQGIWQVLGAAMGTLQKPWPSACSPMVAHFPRGMHTSVETSDRDQAWGMQVHSWRG